jgi:hypothetical protein
VRARHRPRVGWVGRSLCCDDGGEEKEEADTRLHGLESVYDGAGGSWASGNEDDVFGSVKINAIGVRLERTPPDGQDRGVWAWDVLHGSGVVGAVFSFGEIQNCLVCAIGSSYLLPNKVIPVLDRHFYGGWEQPVWAGQVRCMVSRFSFLSG